MANETKVKKPSERQIAGTHYKDMVIQPAEFIERNRLTWCQGNVIKYVCRFNQKGLIVDLQKAQHYLELLMEWEFPE